MWHLVSRSLCDIGHLSLCLYCFAFLSPHPATSISSPMVPLVLLKHTKQYFISEIFTGHCLCFPNARITASRHYAWLLSLSFNGLTFKIYIWCKSKVTLADSYLLSCQLFTARGWKECSILRRNNVWNNLCCALVFSRKKKKRPQCQPKFSNPRYVKTFGLPQCGTHTDETPSVLCSFSEPEGISSLWVPWCLHG